MSQFDQSIARAKKQQRLLCIGLIFGFVLIALIILTLIFASRGTRIEIAPDAALPATISIEQGAAIVAFGAVYSLSKEPKIRVTAERFYPHQQTLSSSDLGQTLTVTLKPLPAEITLSTGLTDDKTAWLIDDEIVAVVDTLVQTFETAGEYQVIVNHPYYAQQVIDFTLQAGEQLERKIQLTPIAGSFAVTSMPSGARVSINEIEKGITPLQIPLKGGTYSVIVALAEFASTQDSIEIKNTDTVVERHYRLSAERGSVELDLQPKGGKLTVEGIVADNLNQLSLEANKDHRISYSKAGYVTQRETVRVSAAASRALQINLEKEMGRVEIVSSPTANISVNGQARGTTPAELSLNAVEQMIELSLPGYRSVSRKITPSAQSPQRLSLILLPEAQANLQEAPRQYQTKAGGELRLFLPNETFTLGAKREEAGQRANEFLRQVRLTKPFYAGTHEVTQAEYSQFDSGQTGSAQQPVTSISWLEAAKFCNWLSNEAGLKPVYTIQANQLLNINTRSNGYRLLTEAEWEWLARKAGRAERTRFVWGNDTVIPKNAANIADESAKGNVSAYVPRYNDGYAGIAPIKSFSREQSGLYDMGGNVSEWTHDSYSLTVPKPDRVYQQNLDTATDSMHVIKGANWRSGSLTELRASFREGLQQPRDDLGFRIGRYLNEGTE